LRDNILDGLAWASLSEKARVARISAKLVRDLGSWSDKHTKTDVKAAVKATAPPYGRGKYVIAAVELEYRRQLPIYRKRQKAQDDWKAYLDKAAKRGTRVNNAYAFAFNRPPHLPTQDFDKPWSSDTYDERTAWNTVEAARDKGDTCVGLTHQDSHVVALVEQENGSTRWHIATRLHKGPIVRTYLRGSSNRYTNSKMNLAEAAVSLGGPKVKAALAKGKRVETDWIGRRTLIHHEGQDFVHAHVEELPWRTTTFVETANTYNPATTYLKPVASQTLGETVTPWQDWYKGQRPDWNDCD